MLIAGQGSAQRVGEVQPLRVLVVTGGYSHDALFLLFCNWGMPGRHTRTGTTRCGSAAYCCGRAQGIHQN